jgi:hypothetical protein
MTTPYVSQVPQDKLALKVAADLHGIAKTVEDGKFIVMHSEWLETQTSEGTPEMTFHITLRPISQKTR